MALKIISYNLNGIRAATRKGLMSWLQTENPDVFLVQETKSQPEQVDTFAFSEMGYRSYLHSAEKPGYSGVGIFSKSEPDHLEVGMGVSQFDQEGRVLRADYGDLSILSVYFPSGTTGDVRQSFKMSFLSSFSDFVIDLKKRRPKLVIAGDLNICHKPIDIHNPVANKNSSGFLPEEREWLSGFLDQGFLDTFRMLHPEPHRYSWWSYRAGARKRNLGWRIDYQLVTTNLKPKVQDADILSESMHSDHCPVSLTLN